MLYLASQSPRRLELLQQLGLRPGVLEIRIPEQRDSQESPEDYVRRVAREKAGAGLLQVSGARSAVVLAADTEVVLGDRVFGKPADAEQAIEMLRALSGQVHLVISTVCVVDHGREATETCISKVRFATLDEQLIAAYVASGEPYGKAGAYAIQGRAASFVAHLEGSYSGVMGLPLFETCRLLKSFHVLC
ncbi:Maf family protein [Pseudomarimonas arenosa]|uniref:dTTP/UTP pyrophosphatase n=1 Tax=Pseudomarimonas arenosa TaxID=2774145 RepID=A0AAW3ZQU2_9GAMM|nr:Maf family protein [Pseudomarimonas arenosa]MBD8526994.1 septum formation inhibitor Maf [Pseudomarimonas arenosa]